MQIVVTHYTGDLKLGVRMASKKYEIVSTVLSISVLIILFSTDVFAACKNWRQTLTYYGSGRNEVVGGNNWRWPIYSDSIHFSLGGNDVLTGRTGRDCVSLWGGPGDDSYKAVRGGNFSRLRKLQVLGGHPRRSGRAKRFYHV